MSKRFIQACIIGIFFLILAAFMDSTSHELDGEKIFRNAAGDGEKSIDLILNADGLEKDSVYKLNVKEEIPSQKQANDYFEKAIAEIEENFCSTGDELEHITKDVNMSDSYVNGVVEAEWLLSDYTVMDYEGHILEDAELDEKSGRIVNASVQLSCVEYKQLYEFSFMVYEKKCSASENLMKSIDEELKIRMNQEGTRELILPEKIGNTMLTWSEKKDSLVLKIALLEVVIVVLIVLSKKEKKKDEIKKINAQMELDYPEIVSKMAILMGAGMTVEQAWNKISARYLDKKQKDKELKLHAYEQMLVTVREISDGESTNKAYIRFAERVNLSSYQRFVRIILQSINKGSSGVCQMLEKESDDAFNERRLNAQKLGEEASTKMLIPMLIMMGIVIAIVIAPAIVNFKM